MNENPRVTLRSVATDQLLGWIENGPIASDESLLRLANAWARRVGGANVVDSLRGRTNGYWYAELG
jgi:hypothetical protein